MLHNLYKLLTHTLLFIRNQIIFIAPRGLKRRLANDIHEDSIHMDGNAENKAYGNCMQIKTFRLFLIYAVIFFHLFLNISSRASCKY